MIGSIGIVGILAGSLFSGPLVVKGRRRAMFITAGIVFIGSGLSLILTVPTLLIGRFVIGFTGGVFNLLASKCMYESVNEKLYRVFGCITNVAICLGGTICAALGLILPTDPQYYREDKLWRLIYSFSCVFAALQIALLLLVFKDDPIDFSIKNGNEQAALRFLKLIYHTPSSGQESFKKYIEQRKQEMTS